MWSCVPSNLLLKSTNSPNQEDGAEVQAIMLLPLLFTDAIDSLDVWLDVLDSHLDT